ncbi:MAG: RsmE family RNA methyltransferase [Gemmatimonadales bacterium]
MIPFELDQTAPPAPPPPPLTLFARGPFQAGGVIVLDEDEAHHVRVRRLEDGAAVRLVDGKGGIATARLAKEKDAQIARVVATTLVPAPPATELWVGAGDRDRFLDVVEKATELGATRIQPIITERSQQVATRFQAVHVEKASRRAREATKQCGTAWTPVVAQPLPLAEALRGKSKAVRLLASAQGGRVPALRESDQVQWLVGPEGGFTEPELAAILAAGFKAVALWRSTLRFDTAALAALALVAQTRLDTSLSGSHA